MLESIKAGMKKWAQGEWDDWYEAGRRAKGTNRDYTGTTWIGYHAFWQGKNSCPTRPTNNS